MGAIAREIKIFVSSQSDVRDERRRLQRVVERLDGQLGAVRFALVRWEEKFYRADATFQKQIDRAVDCDIVMSAFWTRLGTELPPEFDERLAKADPGNAGWQRDLSVACNKVGNVQVAQGHLADALEAYRDCLAISERLATDNADNVRYQLDLVLSHWMLAKLGDDPVGHWGFVVAGLGQLKAKDHLSENKDAFSGRPSWIWRRRGANRGQTMRSPAS